MLLREVLQGTYEMVLHFTFIIRVSFWPALFALWKSPTLLLSPSKLSQFIFATAIWSDFGPGIDENWKQVKEKLITPNAHGVVLDVGAGFGHTVKYLDKTKVTKYVAVEPNANMHDQIRLMASKEGYSEADGTLLILPYGIEDISSILSALNNRQIDTIVSVLALCSVPDPQRSIRNLVLNTFKSGGAFLYLEHILSPKKEVAWWQRLWTPLWSFTFDGCRLDRPSHLYVDEIYGEDGESIWKEREVSGIDSEAETAALHLFEHRIGRYVKT